MPYKPKDIYRGRRKFRVPLAIGLFVLALLLVGTVALFYVMQQFLVYDQTGVRLELPFMEAEEVETVEETPVPTLEPVEVQVIYEDPDFSQIDLGGWEELGETRARFIPFSDAVDEMKLAAAIGSLPEGFNGVVLELKDPSGMLAWASSSETAVGYGTAGTMDYTETVEALHEQGITAAAQISCLADELLAARNWTVTLQTEAGAYKDADGVYWLDPYNRSVRIYLADLMAELAAMGFDEIILADLYHPVRSGYGDSGYDWDDDWDDWDDDAPAEDAAEAQPAGVDTGFIYSVTIQTAPNPVNAICQMALRLTESVEGLDTAVSVRIDENSLRTGSSTYTGQDIDVFWRIFARLYCPCSIYDAEDDLRYAVETMNAGSADIRFVPVCRDDIPDNFKSYVIRSTGSESAW